MAAWDTPAVVKSRISRTSNPLNPVYPTPVPLKDLSFATKAADLEARAGIVALNLAAISRGIFSVGVIAPVFIIALAVPPLLDLARMGDPIGLLLAEVVVAFGAGVAVAAMGVGAYFWRRAIAELAPRGIRPSFLERMRPYYSGLQAKVVLRTPEDSAAWRRARVRHMVRDGRMILTLVGTAALSGLGFVILAYGFRLLAGLVSALGMDLAFALLACLMGVGAALASLLFVTQHPLIFAFQLSYLKRNRRELQEEP